MRRFGLPRQDLNSNQTAPLNWRRGLLRLWVLVSAAWIMAWIVYLALYGIRSGFSNSYDLFAIPVLLVGPPIALFLFGLLARWALLGFKA